MKNLFAFSALFFVSIGMFAQTNVSSKITQVTVYLQGAQLVHTAETQVSQGKQTVVFTGLSADMQPESVVLECGNKNVVFQSVSIRNNYLKEQTPNAKIAELQEKSALVEEKLAALRAEKGVYAKERDMLFRNEAIGGTSNNVPIAEIEKAADFFRKRNNEINVFLLKADAEERKLIKESASYTAQLQELNAKENPPTSEVTVVLDAKTRGEAIFTLKYLVRNAGWAPKYDVRAENAIDPVKLDYHANVFNKSGLDWTEVLMILSTSEPLQGAEKPRLETWDVAESTQRIAGVQKNLESVMIMDMKSNRSDYLKKEDRGGEVAFQQVAVQELSAEFEIELPYTILSDGKPYVVDVTSYSLPATYMHYAVPKQDADAFLMAKVVGWNTLNLVSGKASVYFAGAYLGQSFINTASVDDTLSLSLGRDKRVALSRKKQSELSKRQLLGNNEKETFYFETTVRNNRDKEINVLLEDQLPISSDGQIEVAMLEISGAVLEKNTGKLSWNIKLAPGESKTVTLGYSIKTPKSMKVSKGKFRTIACPSF
ncbi:MAG: hypothetical protein RLZZ155_345 [Bacteroidota bacterium]|jgi:uncharacterized protein (TIGR02231 family)